MVWRIGLRWLAGALLLALASVATRAQAPRPQRFLPPGTFEASSRLVLVPVSVTDNSGKTILGLGAGDFKIFDDQKPQSIISFSREDVPSSIGLVLDVSGSMRNSLGLAKAGAQAFVRDANPSDEFLLLTVSTQPGAATSLSGSFSGDAAGVAQDIAFTKPGGMTALIDTVYLGLTQMRNASHPRRALVVFSDGMDNHSKYSRNQLLRAALEADVQIYTILLPTTPGGTAGGGAPFRPSMIAKPGDRGAETQGPDLLEALADKTGGLHFRARNQAEAEQAMLKTGEALRSQYVIGYQPPDSGTAGKSHRIHVTTSVPKVYIHARSGYYEP